MSELDLQTFVEQEPHDILAYVEMTIAEHQHPDNEFNWLGLAEVASFNARIESNTMDTALVWAKIAVLVYAYLGSALTKTERASFECSAMLLRVACIGRFGPQHQHTLLDPHTVVEWFLSNTGMTLDEAREQSKTSETLPTGQWLELKQIKSRLYVVNELYKDGYVPADSLLVVENWLAIQQELP